jgi:hypothetical protein
MRAILVDWMVEAALEFELPTPILHTAAALLDRCLAAWGWRLPRGDLQLLGCVCLLVASRRGGPTGGCMSVPGVVFIADGQYNGAQVIAMAWRVLAAAGNESGAEALLRAVPEGSEDSEDGEGEALLGALAGVPGAQTAAATTAYAFLEEYLSRTRPQAPKPLFTTTSSSGNVMPQAPPPVPGLVDEAAVLAHFLCDLSLLDDHLGRRYHPATIAAAALCLARCTVQTQLARAPLYVTASGQVLATRSREALALHPDRRPFIVALESEEVEPCFGLPSLRAFVRSARAEAGAVAACAFRLWALLKVYITDDCGAVVHVVGSYLFNLTFPDSIPSQTPDDRTTTSTCSGSTPRARRRSSLPTRSSSRASRWVERT